VTTDVRIATSDDARAIAEIHVASWQEGYRGQLPDSYLKSLSADARETRWAQALRDGAAVLLAEHAGKPAGFVAYGPCRDDEAPAACGEIYALYVDPHAWSTGTGQRLHDGALDALTAVGSAVVTLGS
jgi:GNAT superfamily N-acetyltransferase